MPWWTNKLSSSKVCNCRSQWPRGLRCRSAAARLLRLWVRIPLGAWMYVCCECCVLLGRGLCDKLITRPEEPYRLWCVVMCDLETSWMRRPWPNWGCFGRIKFCNYWLQLVHYSGHPPCGPCFCSESINYAFMSASSVFNLEQKHHLLVSFRIFVCTAVVR